MASKPKFKVDDVVVFTNIFGVCWGLRTITEVGERTGRPVYQIDITDTPWFMGGEENFKLADAEDLTMSLEQLQQKHGFTPTEYFGCW